MIGSHGGTIGGKFYEFKMTMADGFGTKEKLPTVEEVANNIDKILVSEPDLSFEMVMKAD